jgi:ATP-dependent DNA helicase PIF1
MPDMSTEQKECFDAAMGGRNLFISGPGGVGKSFVLREIIEEFKARGQKFRIAASTGVAALNVGGSTIHSLLGTRLSGNIKDCKQHLGTQTMQRAQYRLNFVKTIIIDEISMLSGDYISMIDFWLQQVRSNPEPFGGCQMIFCGDFLQLPPVEKKGDASEFRFAIDSPSWLSADLKTVDLIKSFRQEDQTFVNALNRVRFGEYTKDIRKVFRPCIGRELDEPTHLVATNKEADQINFDKLRDHPGEEISSKPTFTMMTKYTDGVKEKMVRDSLTDSPLCLKVGVPVLLLKNHREGLYINGSRGIVETLHQYEHGEISSIVVKLDTGDTVEVGKEEWERVDGDHRVVATMSHFPVRLGWALTIHKSQGLTLDNVEIDLSHGFACGQAYVALSRLKSLEGLALTIPIDPSIVKAEPRLVEFYDKARVKAL